VPEEINPIKCAEYALSHVLQPLKRAVKQRKYLNSNDPYVRGYTMGMQRVIDTLENARKVYAEMSKKIESVSKDQSGAKGADIRKGPEGHSDPQ